MASVNENVNSQRSTSVNRQTGAAAAGRAAAGAPPAEPPKTSETKPKSPTDKALIAARPQTEVERQQTVLQAVKAAQAAAGAPTEKASKEDEPPTAKKIADGIGLMDGIKEGTRIATSSDEIARLPGIGKAVQSGSRLGKFFSSIANSRTGQAIAHAFQNSKVLAPAARFLGRIAPIAGVAVAGFDINDAVKTSKDPKASTAEKALSSTKAVLSGIAGVAGVATLALAPTGVGAAIAGGIALGAGLLSLGVDLVLGNIRKKDEDAKPSGK